MYVYHHNCNILPSGWAAYYFVQCSIFTGYFEVLASNLSVVEMIASEKKVLETNLLNRTLLIQGSLIDLYTHNVYAISLIAALIGEMVWDCNQIGWPSSRKFSKNPDYDHDEYPFVQYFFYFLNGASICICFYVLSISTIYSMWGPIMATNGQDASAVREASLLMKENQYQIFLLMNIVIILIMTATAFFLWSLLDSIPAAICTVMLVGGSVVVIHYGLITVRNFDPEMTLQQIIFPHFALEEERKDILADQMRIDERLKVTDLLVYAFAGNHVECHLWFTCAENQMRRADLYGNRP